MTTYICHYKTSPIKSIIFSGPCQSYVPIFLFLSIMPSIARLILSPLQKNQEFKKREGMLLLFSIYEPILLCECLADYSTIEATTPAPTVLPPSLIANLSPSSIAIGPISSTSIAMLSPGITISTPSGRLIEPVMSVVLK